MPFFFFLDFGFLVFDSGGVFFLWGVGWVGLLNRIESKGRSMFR
jgi:hypothetical protein